MHNDIYIVYSKGCISCRDMKQKLVSFLSDKDSNNYSIYELDSKSEVAVDLAAAFDVDEVPFVLINNSVILADDCLTKDCFGPYYV